MIFRTALLILISMSMIMNGCSLAYDSDEVIPSRLTQMAGNFAGEMAGEMAGELAGGLAGEVAGEMAGMAGEMAGEISGEMAGEISGEMAGEMMGYDPLVEAVLCEVDDACLEKQLYSVKDDLSFEECSPNFMISLPNFNESGCSDRQCLKIIENELNPDFTWVKDFNESQEADLAYVGIWQDVLAEIAAETEESKVKINLLPTFSSNAISSLVANRLENSFNSCVGLNGDSINIITSSENYQFDSIKINYLKREELIAENERPSFIGADFTLSTCNNGSNARDLELVGDFTELKIGINARLDFQNLTLKESLVIGSNAYVTVRTLNLINNEDTPFEKLTLNSSYLKIEKGEGEQADKEIDLSGADTIRIENSVLTTARTLKIENTPTIEITNSTLIQTDPNLPLFNITGSQVILKNVLIINPGYSFIISNSSIDYENCFMIHSPHVAHDDLLTLEESSIDNPNESASARFSAMLQLDNSHISLKAAYIQAHPNITVIQANESSTIDLTYAFIKASTSWIIDQVIHQDINPDIDPDVADNSNALSIEKSTLEGQYLLSISLNDQVTLPEDLISCEQVTEEWLAELPTTSHVTIDSSILTGMTQPSADSEGLPHINLQGYGVIHVNSSKLHGIDMYVGHEEESNHVADIDIRYSELINVNTVSHSTQWSIYKNQLQSTQWDLTHSWLRFAFNLDQEDKNNFTVPMLTLRANSQVLIDRSQLYYQTLIEQEQESQSEICNSMISQFFNQDDQILFKQRGGTLTLNQVEINQAAQILNQSANTRSEWRNVKVNAQDESAMSMRTAADHILMRQAGTLELINSTLGMGDYHQIGIWSQGQASLNIHNSSLINVNTYGIYGDDQSKFNHDRLWIDVAHSNQSTDSDPSVVSIYLNSKSVWESSEMGQVYTDGRIVLEDIGMIEQAQMDLACHDGIYEMTCPSINPDLLSISDCFIGPISSEI